MRRENTGNVLFLFGMVLIVLSGGCTSPPTTDTIKIGVIIPLTGNGAVYGEWSRNALELAKEETNEGAE